MSLPAMSPHPDVNTCNEQDISNISSQNEVKSSANEQPAISNKANENDVVVEEVIHLDDDILTLLGDAPKEESPVGPEVHNDIASRLQEVLQNGLKKEQKEKIIEDYPIPGNCSLFNAPALNPEVRAAISDLLQKKDASLAARQRQIGTVLAALVKSMDILVNDKSETSQQVLKHVSYASRLLCDSHYIDTKLRRNFLISTLNNKLKDTLKESKRDKNLFGEDLADKLKATKAITKTSQDLRYNKPKSVVNKNPTNNIIQPNLNWKQPQPNTQNLSRRPALPPGTRTAGGPSTSYYRSRAEADNRRRQPAPRARGTAHYKRRH